jgi:hypothetical protein
VGGLALLGYSGMVQRWKTAQATSSATASATKAICAGGATRRSRPPAAVCLFDGELGIQSSFALHSDGDNRNGSVTWSTVVDVVKPRRVCDVVVATARQPARGPDLVVSLLQVECGVTMALRRRIPYGSGLLGAVRSVSLGSVSAQGHAGRFWRLYESEFVGGRRVRAFGPAAGSSGVVLPALISQSNRTSLSCFSFLFFFPAYGLPGPYSCIFLLY